MQVAEQVTKQITAVDIVIIGGGMVGAALALGCGQQGKRVALVEGVTPRPFDSSQAIDLRVSAISAASVRLLASLGVWPAIEAMRTCPYRRLETWEHPACRTRFDARSLQLEQLGYIVENRVIQRALWQSLAQCPTVETFCPDTLASIDFYPDKNRVRLDSGIQLEAPLVVGADGAHSKVRDLAGIGVVGWDYRQHCLLINVKTERPQQDITWQWFTPSGPRSFLPLPGARGSLVWYDHPRRIRQLATMSPAALRAEVLAHFPAELGDIEVLNSGAFPLTRRHASRYLKHRCILVGDAAHTINPLAGQGVNLGFKDVEALLDVLTQPSWQSTDCLSRYEKQRRGDNLLMQASMDVFYSGFSNDLLPLKVLRNAALKIADNAGPLKAKALQYALGL